GYASAGDTPSPAVRLSPNARTTGSSAPGPDVTESGPTITERRSSTTKRAPRTPECSMDFAMISIRDLSMRLTSGGRHVDVLTEVSLDVPAGQFLAVAGPSGSGKSTLLGLIAGLDQPTAGRICVAGVEITRLSEDALARFRRDTLGYVFQAYHLIPTLTALENIAVPLELAGDPDALPRATALLAEVCLADRAHHYPV